MKNMEKLKNSNRLVIKTKDEEMQKLIISRCYVESEKAYQLVILNCDDEPIHNTVIDVGKISITNNQVKLMVTVLKNYGLEQYDEDETTPMYEFYVPYPEDDIQMNVTDLVVKEMNIEYIRGDIYLIEDLIDENILICQTNTLRKKLDLPIYDVLKYDKEKKKTKKISTHL